MENKEIRMQCGYCERETTFRFIHTFWNPAPVRTTEMIKLPGGRKSLVGGVYIIWNVLLCLTCLSPTLEQQEQVVMPGSEPTPLRTNDTRVLYPVPRARIDNIPESVEKEYTAALKYRNSDPNACAVYIGRALDRICRHENVEGKRLIEKLRNLVRKKNLPSQLDTMADQLRELRNIGAHADEDDEVTAEDAPIMLDFLEALLEYLYVAPTKIAKVQARLKKTI